MKWVDLTLLFKRIIVVAPDVNNCQVKAKELVEQAV